ncbi:hypothetical protein [Treponema socranskii]
MAKHDARRVESAARTPLRSLQYRSSLRPLLRADGHPLPAKTK